MRCSVFELADPKEVEAVSDRYVYLMWVIYRRCVVRFEVGDQRIKCL